MHSFQFFVLKFIDNCECKCIHENARERTNVRALVYRIRVDQFGKFPFLPVITI